MTEIKTFFFEGQPVRVVIKDGEPFFIAEDICKILGLDIDEAIESLNQDQVGTVRLATLDKEELN